MNVLRIESTEIIGDYVHVEALIGDAGIVHHGTRWEPPEYGPAFCKSGFYLDEDTPSPVDEADFCSYLDSLKLDWKPLPLDNGDYDLS
mgnify:CR=1 FL=1